MKRTVLLANTSWYLYNFRLGLAHRLAKEQIEVIFVSPHDAYAEKIQAAGFPWVEWKIQRSSVNPLRECLALLRLHKILKNIAPDILHNHTAKCVLYGTISGRFIGIPAIVNSFTGLGHLFISQNPLKKILRFFLCQLYSTLFHKKNIRLIFQNQDDLSLFARLGIADPNQSHLIRGSGVDLHRFQASEAPPQKQTLKILFAGRLLREKGIFELMDAARISKEKGLDLEIHIAGAIDTGNPSAASAGDVRAWGELALFHGHVDELETLIRDSDMVVLPSYREGMPKFLLEAAAMKKPAITSNVPGCREAVEHRVTGLLLPEITGQAIFEAFKHLTENRGLLARYGNAAFEKVKRDFSEESVITATREIYKELGLFSP